MISMAKHETGANGASVEMSVCVCVCVSACLRGCSSVPHFVALCLPGCICRAWLPVSPGLECGLQYAPASVDALASVMLFGVAGDLPGV